MTLYTRRGVAFQIDKADAFLVSRYSWSRSGTGYVATYLGRPKRSACLHELLCGRAPNGLEWDHRNRDKLDNRRSNLRLVTHVHNVRNTGLRVTNTSGAKGVWYDGNTGMWAAEIMIHGKKVWLGRHVSKSKATKARRAAEEALW